MAQLNYSAQKRRYNLDDQPEEVVVADTMRDKILKQLHSRQVRTNITLDEQKQLQRNFISTVTEESLTNKIGGLMSLSKFASLSEKNDIQQILQGSGLNEAETKALLDEGLDANMRYPNNKDQLNSIMEKLSKRLENIENSTGIQESFHGAVPLSRKIYEEECSLATSTAIADKLTNCLVKLEPQSNLMNETLSKQLKELEQQLSNKINKPCHQTVKKTKCNNNPSKHNNSVNPQSLWDSMEIPKTVKGCSATKHTLKDTVLNDQLRNSILNETKIIKDNTSDKEKPTDTSKPFVLTLNPSQLLSKLMIKTNKMSVKELIQQDKFKHYAPGDPSKTIYIKNLHPKVSATEIASIFGNFECPSGPEINYRVMSGKMKGQAFVKFKNKDLAKQALEICNGFIFKGKPMVIAYARN